MLGASRTQGSSALTSSLCVCALGKVDTLLTGYSDSILGIHWAVLGPEQRPPELELAPSGLGLGLLLPKAAKTP